jgi:hypothetical protein
MASFSYYSSSSSLLSTSPAVYKSPPLKGSFLLGQQIKVHAVQLKSKLILSSKLSISFQLTCSSRKHRGDACCRLAGNPTPHQRSTKCSYLPTHGVLTINLKVSINPSSVFTYTPWSHQLWAYWVACPLRREPICQSHTNDDAVYLSTISALAGFLCNLFACALFENCLAFIHAAKFFLRSNGFRGSVCTVVMDQIRALKARS